MKTIYKYALDQTRSQIIETFLGAKPLCVQMQNGYPCLWMLVDPTAKPCNIVIEMVGTRHDQTKREYIGSVRSSICVWHFFIAA